MVLMCKYCGQKGGVEGRTLHKFPLKEPEILKVWLQRMKLGTSFVPTNSSRLCSEHFAEKCFDKKDTRVMLLPGSIPSLFGDYKLTCAYCHATKETDKQLSFRKFPLENPELLTEWMKAAKLKGYTPDKKSVLCSDHFEKNCFYAVANTGYQRLKRNAKPSIFKPFEDAQLNGKALKRPPLEPLPAAKYCKVSNDATRPVHLTDEGNDMKEIIEICDSPRDLHCTNAENVEQVTSITSSPQTPITPTCKDAPRIPNTVKRKRILQHDHSYETSPKSLKRKLIHTQHKLAKFHKESKVQKQHIGRLKRKIRTLKDIVSELRQTRAIPESGLACLDAIADSDISQLLERFLKNKKNVGNQERSPKKKHGNLNVGILDQVLAEKNIHQPFAPLL